MESYRHCYSRSPSFRYLLCLWYYWGILFRQNLVRCKVVRKRIFLFMPCNGIHYSRQVDKKDVLKTHKAEQYRKSVGCAQKEKRSSVKFIQLLISSTVIYINYTRIFISPDWSYFLFSFTVCYLLKLGVAAIFGPQSSHTAGHVQSICDTMEVRNS